jgi:hypothetical protein
MLLCIYANTSYKELSVISIICATPSKGMELVLSQLHAAHPISLENLIWKTIVLTKEYNHLVSNLFTPPSKWSANFSRTYAEWKRCHRQGHKSQ